MDEETKAILARYDDMLGKLNKTIYFGNGAPPLTSLVLLMQQDITTIKEAVQDIKDGNKANQKTWQERAWGLIQPVAVALIVALAVLAVSHGLVK